MGQQAQDWQVGSQRLPLGASSVERMHGAGRRRAGRAPRGREGLIVFALRDAASHACAE